MKHVLVICHGYFGDHLFASSIAKKLLDEDASVIVDYVVGFPQILPLFLMNPYINEVFFTGAVGPSPSFKPTKHYDKIIQLGTVSLLEPPPVEFQKLAGIKNPSPEFTVYTDPMIDARMEKEFEEAKKSGVPIVAIMNNWEPKAYRFTEEEYRVNDDVPNKGYGGRFRDIPYIIDRLQERFITVFVGTPAGVTQFSETPTNSRTLVEEASVLKQCDYFVGAEGGLANLAGGVGCKTIIGSEFLAMLYGWRGCIRPVGAPALGPHLYFPNQKHSLLNPFLTDQEFADAVIGIIDGDLQLVYDWHTNTGGTLLQQTEDFHEQPV